MLFCVKSVRLLGFSFCMGSGLWEGRVLLTSKAIEKDTERSLKGAGILYHGKKPEGCSLITMSIKENLKDSLPASPLLKNLMKSRARGPIPAKSYNQYPGFRLLDLQGLILSLMDVGTLLRVAQAVQHSSKPGARAIKYLSSPEEPYNKMLISWKSGSRH